MPGSRGAVGHKLGRQSWSVKSEGLTHLQLHPAFGRCDGGGGEGNGGGGEGEGGRGRGKGGLLFLDSTTLTTQFDEAATARVGQADWCYAYRIDTNREILTHDRVKGRGGRVEAWDAVDKEWSESKRVLPAMDTFY